MRRLILSIFCALLACAFGVDSSIADENEPSHGGHHHHRHDHHGHSGGFHGGREWGWSGNRVARYDYGPLVGGVYTPYGGWTSGWGGPIWYDPYCWPGPIIFPPRVLPAETLYGPQAFNRFLGLDYGPQRGGAVDRRVVWAPANGGGAQQPARGGQPNRGKGQPQAAQGALGAPLGLKRPAVRVSNAAARARAAKSIDLGDADFLAEQYGQALSDYKQAARLTPDLGEPFFRQGLAQLALGNYERAFQLIVRGLSLAPEWPDSKFRLDSLYGKNKLAKSAHAEALALAIDDAPDNAKLWFLLAVRLYFDGESKRSRTFFEQAGELADGDRAHVDLFLEALDRKQAKRAALDL